MDVISLWWLSLAIFAVVVVVVAVLLGLVIAAARSIAHNAGGIWTVGKQIAGNTVSIWMLEQTNASLDRIAGAVGGLAEGAGALEEKLDALAGAGKG